MGNSKSTFKQIILTGPESSGKTTFLYQRVLKKSNFKPTQTIGFNYEEIVVYDNTFSIWDVGGSEASQLVMPSIYKNVQIHALVYIVNYHSLAHLNQARIELHRLVVEEEMRQLFELVIIYNDVQVSKEDKKSKKQESLQGFLNEGIKDSEKQKNLDEFVDLQGLSRKGLKIHSYLYNIKSEDAERMMNVWGCMFQDEEAMKGKRKRDKINK